LFGGQVLANCVSAASQTVNASTTCASMHGLFLRPGDVSLPVVYQVEQVRDGDSFNAVTAIRRAKPILPAARPFSSLKRHSSPEPDAWYQEPEALSETELSRMVAATIPEHASVPPAISPSRFAGDADQPFARNLRAGQARVFALPADEQAAAAGWRMQ
jgi:acyl-CoA thioesterase II